jgi:hypothetical protein
LGETSQPQNSGKAAEITDALAATQEIDAEGSELNLKRHDPLKMELRSRLVPQQMTANASHPFQRDHGSRILGYLDNGRGSFHNGHCRREIAKSY